MKDKLTGLEIIAIRRKIPDYVSDVLVDEVLAKPMEDTFEILGEAIAKSNDIAYKMGFYNGVREALYNVQNLGLEKTLEICSKNYDSENDVEESDNGITFFVD